MIAKTQPERSGVQVTPHLRSPTMAVDPDFFHYEDGFTMDGERALEYITVYSSDGERLGVLWPPDDAMYAGFEWIPIAEDDVELSGGCQQGDGAEALLAAAWLRGGAEDRLAGVGVDPSTTAAVRLTLESHGLL